MIRALALTGTILAAGSAVAAETPKPCKGDPQILCAVYKPDQVYIIPLSPDVATTITLKMGEHIAHKVILDSSPFDMKTFGTRPDQPPAYKNNVMITPQPSEVGKTENMTLMSQTPEGQEKFYPLILQTIAKEGAIHVTFTYPDDDAKQRASQYAGVVAQRTQDKISDRLNVSVYYPGGGVPGLNWKYECRCSRGWDLVPDSLDDNGTTTVVRYAGNRSIPAFFQTSLDGHETPIHPRRIAQTDLYELPAAALIWRLRRGQTEVAEIVNRSFHPERGNWHTGTVAPDVIRTVAPTPPPSASAPSK